MKNLIKIFFACFIVTAAFLINACDPFDELYLTLAMKANFNIEDITTANFTISADTCLSSFEDYDDNKDNIEEIRYISSAYLTADSTDGLVADSLRITVSRGDNSAQLFSYTINNFEADKYVNNALEIILTQQEINNINAYLSNPKEDKCFIAKLECFNNTLPTTLYDFRSVIDILTQLKIKP